MAAKRTTHHVYEIRGADPFKTKHVMRFEIFRNKTGLNFLPYCQFSSYKAWSANPMAATTIEALADQIADAYTERFCLIDPEVEYLGDYTINLD